MGIFRSPQEVASFKRKAIAVNDGEKLSYDQFITHYLPEYLTKEWQSSHAQANAEGLGTPERRPHAERKMTIEERLKDARQLGKVVSALSWSKTLADFPEMNGEAPDRHYVLSTSGRPREIYRSTVENQDMAIGRLAEFMHEDGKEDIARRMEQMRQDYAAMVEAMQRKISTITVRSAGNR